MLPKGIKDILWTAKQSAMREMNLIREIFLTQENKGSAFIISVMVLLSGLLHVLI